jgi:hypothetical protein
VTTHVIKREVDVNIELGRPGAASVWFDGGERGRYAWQPLDERPPGRGEEPWALGRSPGTRLDPEHGAETR